MANASTPAETFFESFLGPLLHAQEVTVGLPIDRATFEILCAEVESRGDAVAGFDIALQMQAARLLAEPPIVSFDLDTLRLAVALHQLLFSFHGAAEQGRVSGERLARLATDTARMLGAVRMPTPDDPSAERRARILAHHLVVDPFFLLYRRDVSLFFRVGQKQFFGQEVEWLRMPFRWRVQYEEVHGTDVAARIFAREVGQVFAMLLRFSPLTLLLRADRLFESFSFDGLEPVLTDQALCRLAVNTIIDRGLASFMPAFAVGMQALVGAPSSRGLLGHVARFLVTLALSQEQWQPHRTSAQLLDARYAPPSDAMRFQTPAVDGEAAMGGETDSARRARMAREGWAIVASLLARPDALGLPAPDRQHEACERLRRRLELMRGDLGHDTLAGAERLITRALATSAF